MSELPIAPIPAASTDPATTPVPPSPVPDDTSSSSNVSPTEVVQSPTPAQTSPETSISATILAPTDDIQDHPSKIRRVGATEYLPSDLEELEQKIAKTLAQYTPDQLYNLTKDELLLHVQTLQDILQKVRPTQIAGHGALTPTQVAEVRQALSTLHAEAAQYARHTSLLQQAQAKLRQITNNLEQRIQQKTRMNQHLSDCYKSLLMQHNTYNSSIQEIQDQLKLEIGTAQNLLNETADIQKVILQQAKAMSDTALLQRQSTPIQRALNTIQALLPTLQDQSSTTSTLEQPTAPYAASSSSSSSTASFPLTEIPMSAQTATEIMANLQTLLAEHRKLQAQAKPPPKTATHSFAIPTVLPPTQRISFSSPARNQESPRSISSDHRSDTAPIWERQSRAPNRAQTLRSSSASHSVRSSSAAPHRSNSVAPMDLEEIPIPEEFRILLDERDSLAKQITQQRAHLIENFPPEPDTNTPPPVVTANRQKWFQDHDCDDSPEYQRQEDSLRNHISRLKESFQERLREIEDTRDTYIRDRQPVPNIPPIPHPVPASFFPDPYIVRPPKHWKMSPYNRDFTKHFYIPPPAYPSRNAQENHASLQLDDLIQPIHDMTFPHHCFQHLPLLILTACFSAPTPCQDRTSNLR